MKVFDFFYVEEAIQYAGEGKVALHLHNVVFDESPLCFRMAVRARKEPIGHLFDQNKARLVSTAKRLGVKVIFIDKEDTKDQHIDLCAGPLKKLLLEHLHALVYKRKYKSAQKVIKLMHSYHGARPWIP
jgi:hypothetical protein